MYPVRLESPRVVLREVTADDVEGILGWSSQDAVTEWLPWDSNDHTAAVDFVQQSIARAAMEPRTQYDFVAVGRDDGRVIGGARIGADAARHFRADIGYALDSACWGRGLGTEVAALLIAFGFRGLGMHRVWATCRPDNLASARVLEKVGMQLEGRLRGHVHVKGAFRDSLVYGILRPEWDALEQEQ